MFSVQGICDYTAGVVISIEIITAIEGYISRAKAATAAKLTIIEKRAVKTIEAGGQVIGSDGTMGCDRDAGAEIPGGPGAQAGSDGQVSVDRAGPSTCPDNQQRT